LEWAAQSGSRRMEKYIAQVSKTCDEALKTLLKAAYYVGRKLSPLISFLLVA